MIYITGDTHGNFKHIESFCKRMDTSTDDILIILGDAGINFYGEEYDRRKKIYLNSLPITLFCIHGNHEQRPYTISSYKEKEWHEGIVYYEEEFSSILFAKDGEIFDLDGKKTIVLGGAYSIDKYFRLLRGYPWWSDEQPSMEIKQYAEQRLEEQNWKIDIVLSHTGPLKFEPREMFLEGIDQSRVDKSTEIWLDYIENKLSYKKWYFGHYHTEKKIDKVEIKFNDISLFEI
ncbi:metallophosphoesterase [Erysipelotrichaceae bacterium HCN-30851]